MMTAGMMGFGQMQPPAQTYDPQQQILLMQQEAENAKLQQDLENLIGKKETEEIQRDKDKMDTMLHKLNVSGVAKRTGIRSNKVIVEKT